ncbi:hypothetical protein CsatB_011513 [Cannabis sativa]|uniref:Uncharacterized protein n=1 Tax=Cannabis sativa TaxID=3483 RepID=A0A7J6F8U0_CANSA|nr:uncharacterized protein LOC115706204 [Cannabis sativa]KAF4367112.1 hypothetical protein F8388_006420 [Cannabis sativa]KAF4400080.1 hypothetical protein G4B88_021294 [Cannabis sativa]
MATNILHFRPSIIVARAFPDSNSDQARRKTASANWWTPLFDLSSEPDYIDTGAGTERKDKTEFRSESVSESKILRSKFAPGCFTEDKAKRLRMLTKESESFHDVMYHSAIASRLASDFNKVSDP